MEGEGGAEAPRGSAAPVAVFALALAVRVAWWLGVQRPEDTVYSDMGGYVARAVNVLEGRPADLCFPPGAHGVYALEMLVFGTDGLAAMGGVQALLGAAVAPLTLLAARHALRTEAAAIGVGIAVALWYPLVTFGGFFSSEVPYAFFLAIAAWLTARAAARGATAGGPAAVAGPMAAAAAGLAIGLAYIVRPPILLAAAFVSIWAGFRRVGLRWVLAFGLPVALAVTLGAARYRVHAGEWGLISNNGAVQSFFAWTDYRTLVARALRPNGTEHITRFTPPARTREEGFSVEFNFDGDNCDAAPLLAERDRVVAASSLPALAARAARNVRHLAYGNTLWPERREAKEGARRALLDGWAALVGYGLVPGALAGLVGVAWSARRAGGAVVVSGPVFAREALAWFVVALVLGAAAYTGEARYRVPYDPVLLIFVGFAAEELGARLHGPRARGAGRG